eukprot:GHVQ01042701.1.p1 GENE.GHVQ01042701.1~~GHVQ01042701.1.p1  ORF type:complete len:104 (-),score=9.43 GHVQ01042701.1:1146-1457(-)
MCCASPLDVVKDRRQLPTSQLCASESWAFEHRVVVKSLLEATSLLFSTSSALTPPLVIDAFHFALSCAWLSQLSSPIPKFLSEAVFPSSFMSPWLSLAFCKFT